MPIKFFFDSENNILYEKGVGEVTLKEFDDYRELLAKTELRSGLRCIADYRTAVVNLSYEDILATIEKTQKAAKGLQNVGIAVCAPDDLGYGIARIYGSINESQNYRVDVFRTIEEACSFIGIDAIPPFDA